jgi:hypothetical protein
MSQSLENLPPVSFEEYANTAVGLTVARERVGSLVISTIEGGAGLNAFRSLDPVRRAVPAIGLSAQDSRGRYRYVGIPSDNPEAPVYSGSGELDPDVLIGMATEGVGLFVAYQRLSEDDRHRANTRGQRRVWDEMHPDFAQDLDVVSLWQRVFPEQFR